MPKLYTALITPLDSSQNIDFIALDILLDDQITGGVDGLVLLGTTAEAELLSNDDKHKLILYVLNKVPSHIDLIFGCGRCSTKQTIEQIETYRDLGAKKFMVITPPYVKPSQEGVIEHFRSIDKLGVPFILYYHPFRTGCILNQSTIKAVLNMSNCIGLKDASGGCDLISKLKTDYQVFSGDDGLLLPHLSLGALGIISVLSNIIPKTIKNVLETFATSPSEALLIFSQYQKMLELIFETPNPIGIKTALFSLNKIQNQLCLPYTSAETEYLIKIKDAVQSFFPKEIGLSPISSSV